MKTGIKKIFLLFILLGCSLILSGCFGSREEKLISAFAKLNLTSYTVETKIGVTNKIKENNGYGFGYGSFFGQETKEQKFRIDIIEKYGQRQYISTTKQTEHVNDELKQEIETINYGIFKDDILYNYVYENNGWQKGQTISLDDYIKRNSGNIELEGIEFTYKNGVYNMDLSEGSKIIKNILNLNVSAKSYTIQLFMGKPKQISISFTSGDSVTGQFQMIFSKIGRTYVTNPNGLDV